jgi:hypothetical protein
MFCHPMQDRGVVGPAFAWSGAVPHAWAIMACLAFATGSCRSRTLDISTDAAPPPRWTLGTGDAQSPRAKDELWRRASAEDPVDLARLADREGAAGLLEGLEEGGAVGLTALAALPFADDAEAAYARLGEIVRQVDPNESVPLVTAVEAIARKPMQQREPVDPVGMRSCAAALLALARRTDLPAAVRAPAISALRLLAERHGIDRAAIPTDLDPK